ncbi:MAG: murein L,D-transpeptidase catalytic domain family protein [Chitinophagales bacterium]|nr:murein L,D-transpeptidase catalytic domain family protein [Chitinophagales bacterium]MCO5281539.1 murein L,D-transpeptidase catalytic domain family protein [Chitinophagales bacterium]HRN94032.1 murein L,D-transpeptidase catalytic domain family protein [Chitinophagales bacterium]HRP39032.1 murein L,D-transpeptidase catalytic domain family protein [Chitinophagales bacterium]
MPRPFFSSSSEIGKVYEQLNLKQLGLSKVVFEIAVKGFEKLFKQGKLSTDILSVCDFSQSSNQKRLFVIDLENRQVLFNSLVAHGKNTGEEFASKFSNIPSSLQSSLGFYVTGNTYQGKHGLSLKLNGMEKGFNDNAESRAIVMHGADYVSENFINEQGRLGRSFGCPSVPVELCRPIINSVKEGSCLFIYYPDKNYLSHSKLVK